MKWDVIIPLPDFGKDWGKAPEPARLFTQQGHGVTVRRWNVGQRGSSALPGDVVGRRCRAAS
jgi:hypothetical protein